MATAYHARVVARPCYTRDMTRLLLLAVAVSLLSAPSLASAPDGGTPAKRPAVSLCFVNATTEPVALYAYAGAPRDRGVPRDYRHMVWLLAGASAAVPDAFKWTDGASFAAMVQRAAPGRSTPVSSVATAKAAPGMWCTLAATAGGVSASCAAREKGAPSPCALPAS
jgi:hypothetical protein